MQLIFGKIVKIFRLNSFNVRYIIFRVGRVRDWVGLPEKIGLPGMNRCPNTPFVCKVISVKSELNETDFMTPLTYR